MKHETCQTLFILLLFTGVFHSGLNSVITQKEVKRYRERVVSMFHHAYDGYIQYAYPYDELRPITCDGHDTWGSYSLTLIDAMDTLLIMGNHSEFRRVAEKELGKMDFDKDINVSVFETNIRVIGGLLSAHLLSKRAGLELEPGWPCSGPLLTMAETVAKKLLPAFDTPTGMPYGTVNLLYGVPKGETPVTCTAGVGTFILEFGALSRLTGDPIFEKVAMRAMRALWKYRSPLGLVGNHIDVKTGKWTALDASIGGGIDSYFEYLAKGAIMLQIPELLEMFQSYVKSVEKYLKREDWYLWAHMTKGGITLPVFTSLDAYWPGVQAMLGDIDKAMKTMHNFHQVWKQYGFLPEFYNIAKNEAHTGREGYPLRPELVESAVYLYKATRDPYLLQIGADVLESIEYSTRTRCGYATVKDVRTHQLENRMESFFLAETTKYLYLLFDPDNFIHNTGSQGTVIQTPNGECVIDTGGYVFNTEAHPIDLAAVHCCSPQKKEEDTLLQEFHDDIDLLALMNIVDSNDGIFGEKMKLKKKPKKKDPNDINNENAEALKNIGRKIERHFSEYKNLNDKKCDEASACTSNKGEMTCDTVTASDSEQKTSEIITDDAQQASNKLTYKENIPAQSVILTIGNKNKENAETMSDKSLNSKEASENKEILQQHNPQRVKVQVQTSQQKITISTESLPPTPKVPLTSGTTDKDTKIETVALETQLEKMLKLIMGQTGGQVVEPVPSTLHLYKIMKSYSLNYTQIPEIMVCPARPFHSRLSVMGEMFEDDET